MLVEGRNHRRHEGRAEILRHGYAQQPAWIAVDLQDFLTRRACGLDDLFAAGEVDTAGLGQVHAARRSREEFGANRLLVFGNAPRDGRGRHAEDVRCANEAAFPRDSDEMDDIAQIVHGSIIP